MIPHIRRQGSVNFVAIRLERRKSVSQIMNTVGHNLRAHVMPNIDPAGCHRVLWGPSQPDALWDEIKKKWPQKRRKDAVLAVEGIIVASATYFFPDEQQTGTGRDLAKVRRFEEAGLVFAQKEFGQSLVSVVSHQDEYVPHLHLLIVPILNNRLNAKKIIGNRSDLSKLQDRVASHYESLGFQRGIKGSKANHVSLSRYQSAVNQPLPPRPGPAPKHPEPLSLLDSMIPAKRQAHEEAMQNYQRKRLVHEKELQKYVQNLEQYAKPNIVFLQQNRDLKRTIQSMQKKIVTLEQASRNETQHEQAVAKLKRQLLEADKAMQTTKSLQDQVAALKAELANALVEIRSLQAGDEHELTMAPDLMP